MAKFTTRVELYGNPSGDDYTRLHDAMAKEGFNRSIWYEGEQIKWQMPHAEYNRETELTTDGVLESAKRAAATVWRDFAVFVTKSDGSRSWYNLKRAN